MVFPYKVPYWFQRRPGSCFSFEEDCFLYIYQRYEFFEVLRAAAMGGMGFFPTLYQHLRLVGYRLCMSKSRKIKDGFEPLR